MICYKCSENQRIFFCRMKFKSDTIEIEKKREKYIYKVICEIINARFRLFHLKLKAEALRFASVMRYTSPALRTLLRLE